MLAFPVSIRYEKILRKPKPSITKRSTQIPTPESEPNAAAGKDEFCNTSRFCYKCVDYFNAPDATCPFAMPSSDIIIVRRPYPYMVR